MADRIGGLTAETVIAKKTLVVHDEALGIDRQVIAGLPVPPDLVEAYKDAGGETGKPDLAKGLAGETVVVHDDQLGIDRRVIAGQPIPPDLVDAYNAKVGRKSAAKAADSDDAPKAKARTATGSSK